MRRSENFVLLIGNCGKDPVMGDANGTPVATMSLATTEGFKKADGTWQDKTTWHYCKVFGKDAQMMCDVIRKGDVVTVVGKIENRTVGEGDQRKTYSSVVCRQFTVQPKVEHQDQGQPYAADQNHNDDPGW